MSGVYLVVWDQKSESLGRVLRPTSGGWPHVTLAYTGDHLSQNELLAVAKDALDEWAMKPVTIMGARINSFDCGGKQRHDILLDIAESKEIESTRQTLFRERFPELSKQFCMMDPHITVRNFWSLEQAEAELPNVQAQLPHTVQVLGVTID